MLGGAQDARIQQLGRRLIAFHAGHLLSPKYNDTVQEFLAEKWTASALDTKWTTIASVQLQLDELEEDSFDETLLREMKDFYRGRVEAQGYSFDG